MIKDKHSGFFIFTGDSVYFYEESGGDDLWATSSKQQNAALDNNAGIRMVINDVILRIVDIEEPYEEGLRKHGHGRSRIRGND